MYSVRGEAMTWISANSANVIFWITTMVGLYTVYIGIQMQRRKNDESKVKLKPAEISIGLALVVIDCFMLGVRAVHIWAT
jgi:hypothetical protein